MIYACEVSFTIDLTPDLCSLYLTTLFADVCTFLDQ